MEERIEYSGLENSMEDGGGTAAQPQDPRAVWLYPDGVYRWVYQKNLFKNRFEMNYIINIVLLVFGLTWLIIIGAVLAAGIDRDRMTWGLGIVTGICVGGGALTAAIVLLVQWISAKSRGGVDEVGFEMDDGGVRQIRSEKAQKVDDALEIMAAFTGLVGKNAAIAARREEIVSGTHSDITDFAKVRRIKVHPRYDVIDVTLKGNYKCRVYARQEDLEFVREFIASRAPARASR